MFQDMDANNDKTLNWDEFSDVFAKKDPKRVQYVWPGLKEPGKAWLYPSLSACLSLSHVCV